MRYAGYQIFISIGIKIEIFEYLKQNILSFKMSKK